jgi:hypothetical protein
MLLSLANCLPASTTLSRQARRIAAKLSRPHARSLDHRAGDLLARLLDATDTGLTYAEDGVLDSSFDDL